MGPLPAINYIPSNTFYSFKEYLSITIVYLCLQPPVAPTSHNYTEMRDKLRQRLTKRKVPVFELILCFKGQLDSKIIFFDVATQLIFEIPKM